jgi:hypothetical protein
MSLLRNINVGVAAGLSGSAAMHVFRLVWENVGSRDGRHTLFGFDRESDVNAARLGYELFFDRVLSEAQAGRVGVAMHYAFGAVLGIAYQFIPPPARSDVAFGALLWLCADELLIAVSDISDPFRKSAASHASAFAAHLIFGAVTGYTTRLLQSGRNHLNTNLYA